LYSEDDIFVNVFSGYSWGLYGIMVDRSSLRGILSYQFTVMKQIGNSVINNSLCF